MSANTLVFRLLLAMVVLSPLPLGSNRPLAWSALVLAVGLLLAGWSLALARGRAEAPVPLGRLWPAAIPFGLALLWPLAQASPLTPAAWHHPLWQEAAAALTAGGQTGALAGRVALAPDRAVTGTLLLLAYAGTFFLAAQLGRERAREGLLVFAWAGVAYATYGLVVHLSGMQKILWLDKWAYQDNLTSTFVNRNAYGAYAGIGVVCCAALYLEGLSRRWPGQMATDVAERVLVRSMPFLVGVLVVAMALLLTGSRGALAATAAGLLVLWAGLLAGRVLRPWTATLAIGGIVVVGLGALSMGGDATFARFAEQGLGDDTRSALNRTTLAAIAGSPWLGHGLGGYPVTLALYRDAGLPDPDVYQHAHNLHLELLADLGLPAAALLYAAVAVVLATCALGLRRRRRGQAYPAVALAVAVLLGLHGLVDFSLQMPAVALSFAFLLGLGFTQSFPSGARPPDGRQPEGDGPD